MKKFEKTLLACLGALLFMAALTTSIFSQCVDAPSGMTNWWTGDNNTFDIVGGEHGTLMGDATYADGQVANAFSLDGSGDFISVANDEEAAFNFDGSFSIDAWINLDTVPAEFAPIVSQWNDLGTNERSYFLAIQNVGGQARLRFDVSGNGFYGLPGSSQVTSSTAIALDTWVHVAAVFDTSAAGAPALRIYINGQLATPDAARTFTSTAVVDPFDVDEPLLIGAGDLGGNVRDFFDGLIDEVELFDRALTGTEILSLYNAGASGKTITISFDVKPGNGDDADPINLGSKGKTPVAILSTETFDATTVDIGSVRFAGAMVSVKKNGEYHASYEDVNDDGLIDLVLHFDTQSLQLSDSSTEATLSGVTASGRCISGTDEIVIVPRS